MNRADLLMELERAGIPKDCYCLNGGLPSEAYCLDWADGTWEVYYSERGVKSGLKSFTRECDACAYFLSIVREEVSCEDGGG